MADHTRKVNDTLPPLDATLSDADGPFDMTNYRPRFVMKSSGDVVIADGSTANGQVQALDTTAGRLRFNFSSSHVDTPGNYLAEFELSTPSTQRITFPSATHISIVLKPELST